MTSNNDEKKFVILIVDDIVKNLQVLGNTLSEENYEISMANNGFQALRLVEKVNPDLILLDVLMPDMNGFEVCEKIKANEKFKDTPIIFLTARTETEDVVQGFQKGGVDYITKPFKKEELLARIKTHIELKNSKDMIKLQNEKLTSLNKEKNEFLGIAAHDLKNPLSSIKGLADLIKLMYDDLSKEEIVDISMQIKRASEFMFQIVTDLLDINAIEEGKIKINFEEFNIVDLLSRILDKYKLRAQEKSIQLHINSFKEEIKVHSDPVKSLQVFDNIVSNAIKFSPFSKNIFINITLPDNTNYCRIEVKDEGPGISADDQTKLFGKFTKLTARPTNNENSTGLGLSIFKRLVEEMKVKIWCESKLGEGASFFIEFLLSNK